MTHPKVYLFYGLLLLGSLLCCALIPVKRTELAAEAETDRRWFRWFFHANMIFCMILPILLSIIYSYSSDYQPQGRYLLPMLVPLCFYCVRGMEKLCYLNLWDKAGGRWKGIIQKYAASAAVLMVIGIVLVCVYLTIFKYVLPFYTANPNGI